MLPFFKKSEKNLNIENLNREYHGVDGELTISRYPYIDTASIMLTDAFNQAGLPIRDFNGAEQVGTMQSQAFSQDGQRMSANNAFIKPIRYKRKNLTVKVNSFVVKILLNGNRAYGVKYIRNGRTYKATARKEVILSAGPIRSPMILMQSGIGPRSHLEELGIKVVKDLPVGHNLHDHPTFDGILIVLPNETATTVTNEQLIESLFAYKDMEIKDGPLSGNGPVNSVAFIKTDPDLPAPNIQFQHDVAQSWREYIRGPSQYKSLSIFPSCFYDGILSRTMLLTPKSRGQLWLNKTDIYGHPKIDVNYFGDYRDLVAIIKGVRFLLTLDNTPAFKKRGAYFYKESLAPCEAYPWGSDEYIVCMAMSYTSTTYHPVGTCKMGPSWDATAVVDPRLRVYGIEGLRVIDSSIMPCVPRGNTNAPSIMVGERGVALVLEDWL